MNKVNSGLLSVILILILFLVIGVVISIYKNSYADILPGIKIEINTPKPVIVNCTCKETGFLKRKLTEYVTVQNNGGSGKVLVTFYLSQDGKDYQRIKSIYMKDNGQINVFEIFSEVTYLGSDVHYSATATAQ